MFNKFLGLIEKSKELYEEKKLNIKLWNRFWNVLEAYNQGETYQSVLSTYFGGKSKAEVNFHKKNKNFNTNLS